MKKLTSMKAALLSSGILFVLFNGIVFSLNGFRDHGPAFWLSVVFMNIAVVATILCVFLLKGRTEEPRDWFLGYPFYKHCFAYLLVTLLVSVIFIALDHTTLSWGLVFSVQLLVLAVFAALIISCFMAKQTVEEVQTAVKVNTNFMKQLRLDAEALCAQAEDAAVKAAAQALCEELRYSDPVSSPDLAEAEQRLAAKLDDACACLTVKDNAGALEACKSAMLLLKDRNRRCKAMKN